MFLERNEKNNIIYGCLLRTYVSDVLVDRMDDRQTYDVLLTRLRLSECRGTDHEDRTTGYLRLMS